MAAIKIASVLGATLLFINVAQAETKYIKDNWNVGLYTEPGGEGNSLGLIASGTKLEVLAVDGIYSQVRTGTGAEGWTKTSYLVSQPTNDIKLKAAQAEIASLNNKVKQLSAKQNSGESAQLKKQLTALQTQHRQLKQELEQSKAQALKKPVAAQASAANPSRKESVIQIISIGLVALLCGFIVGQRLTEAKVKERFNGRKVW